jgi:hypothetical protein
VAVTLENRDAKPIVARVRIRGGAGLRIEGVRGVGVALDANTGGESGAVALTVPPHETARLVARVEAARIGAGSVEVEIETGRSRQTHAGAYRVLDVPEPATAEAGLRVRRSVYIVTEAPQPPVDPDAEPPKVVAARQEWQHAPVGAGERLAAGQTVLVRDEFVLDRALDDLTWTQRLPANVHPFRSDPYPARRVGESGNRGLESISYTVGRLEAGAHIHEYFVVPVRPGVCLLPPPEVRSGGAAVPVVLEPAETRIIVDERN